MTYIFSIKSELGNGFEVRTKKPKRADRASVNRFLSYAGPSVGLISFVNLNKILIMTAIIFAVVMHGHDLSLFLLEDALVENAAHETALDLVEAVGHRLEHVDLHQIQHQRFAVSEKRMTCTCTCTLAPLSLSGFRTIFSSWKDDAG